MEVLKVEYHPEWFVSEENKEPLFSYKCNQDEIWMHIGNFFFGLVRDE